MRRLIATHGRGYNMAIGDRDEFAARHAQVVLARGKDKFTHNACNSASRATDETTGQQRARREHLETISESIRRLSDIGHENAVTGHGYWI